MEMQPIQLNNLGVETPLLKASVSYDATKAYPSFGQFLDASMVNLNDMANQAQAKIDDFASGKNANVADVMVAVEKTGLATELAIQVRNRLVEGYSEIMRMQI